MSVGRMRAVVTGADGFLGANLCRALIDAGHEVTAAALRRKGHTSLDALGVSCRVEYGDITDSAFVDRVILGTEAEWVFHLAAVSIVRIAQADPRRAYETNIMGTVNVLEACRKSAHVKSVLVASSDKAYGDHGGQPYRESMPLLPIAPYEVSKAAADLIAQSYGSTYGLPVKVLRCANLYGPGDLNWSRLVPNSCRLALSGKSPVVHEGSGGMQREWLYVEDAVAAYLLLAERGQPGPYNVGSGSTGGNCTAFGVAAMISREADGAYPTLISKAAPFAEIPAQMLDSTKVEGLGWKPTRTMMAGVSDTVDWYSRYLGMGTRWDALRQVPA